MERKRMNKMGKNDRIRMPHATPAYKYISNMIFRRFRTDIHKR